jgi:hypothetical protein
MTLTPSGSVLGVRPTRSFPGATESGKRDPRCMTPNAQTKARGASAYGVLAPLDIADAMDLLASAANDASRDFAVQPVSRSDVGDGPNRYAFDGEPRGTIGHALSMANVAVDDLESMRDHSLRDLYRDGRKPIPITLGALIVLDAAQRSQDHGRQWDDVLDDATAAAARFLDLASLLPAVLRRCDPTHALRDFKPPVRRVRPSPRESSCEFTHAISQPATSWR